jgi:hypothetical protein
MRKLHLLAALPLTCLFAGNALAQAAACNKPLTRKSEIQMESMGGGPATIPVKINGKDQKLTLATAGTTTQVDENFAKANGLEIKRADGVLLENEMGMTSRDEVVIADFSMPGLHGTNLKWPVSIGGGFGGGEFGGGAGGRALFSLNYMLPYDIDVDFGSDKLNFFLQDHCPGAVMYWKAPGEVGVVPITLVRGRVTVPVSVDGKPIRAVIDTAARGSSVYAAIAEKILGIADARTAKTLAAKTVSIGKLTLNDVNFMVRPDINSMMARDDAQGMRAKKAGIDFEMANPEVILGMDVLRKLHLYMAFGENRLYVTGTTDTRTAAAAPKAP